MNLGMLLSWEQIYLMKVKKQSNYNTEEEMKNFLEREMEFTAEQIRMAYLFYDFANEHFIDVQWNKVESLFNTLNKGRLKMDIESMMSILSEVLWEMGELFGSNITGNYH